MLKPAMLALALALAVPMVAQVAQADEITLVPAIKLHIGDTDTHGRYWDGGYWRDSRWWHDHYEWRDNHWYKHDRKPPHHGKKYHHDNGKHKGDKHKNHH